MENEDIFDKDSDLNILIEKAYIEDLCLNIDIIDKIKEYFQQAKEFVETLWDRIIDFCWSDDSKKKEVDKK